MRGLLPMRRGTEPKLADKAFDWAARMAVSLLALSLLCGCVSRQRQGVSCLDSATPQTMLLGLHRILVHEEEIERKTSGTTVLAQGADGTISISSLPDGWWYNRDRWEMGHDEGGFRPFIAIRIFGSMNDCFEEMWRCFTPSCGFVLTSGSYGTRIRGRVWRMSVERHKSIQFREERWFPFWGTPRVGCATLDVFCPSGSGRTSEGFCEAVRKYHGSMARMVKI